MYADTSVLVKKIIDRFDIDLCKCFGIKWKHSTCEIPCLLKSSNADDDIVYMHVADKDVWLTEEHELEWDRMWENGKQHGMELYTRVYHMCLNNVVPWASKHAVAYVQACELCMKLDTPHRERTQNIAVLSWGIRCLYD